MPEFIPYIPAYCSPEEQNTSTQEFFGLMEKRCSVLMFSRAPIPKAQLETVIRGAGTAPGGANKQQWMFVVVTDSRIKKEGRMADEEKERKKPCTSEDDGADRKRKQLSDIAVWR